MSIAVSQLLTAALAEIRVARAGDVPSADDMDLALTLFNELIDSLNAEKRAIGTVQFKQFTGIANHQPHTIGDAAAAGDWTITGGRPVEIHGANLILSGTAAIRKPIAVLNDDEWNAVRAKNITAAIPSSLWYQTDFPLGSVYLWPIVNAAFTIELYVDTPIVQVVLSDTLNLAPGYQELMRLAVAKKAAAPFGQVFGQGSADALNVAWQRVGRVNDGPAPSVRTADGGMPGGAPSGGFNFRTGEIE